MKRFFLIAALSFILMSAYCQSDADINSYISTYKEIAISEEIRTGVPAAITLAQGILETNAGQCTLVKSSNNHFGIKCKGDWNGSVVYHDDDAKGECFRSYNNAEDSYRDHSDFLKNRPNYSFLFNLDPTDYEGWAKGLKRAGYATNPAYASMLIKYIVNNHLQDYTLLALQRANGNEPTMASNMNIAVVNSSSAQEHNDDVDDGEASKQAPITATVAQTTITAPTALYPAGVFTINGTKVVYTQQGTSLFALASKYNISYSRLLEFNELSSGNVQDKNQLIYLAKKEKKGNKPYHVVTVDETLSDIAQIEGVRLESLTDYNRLTPNSTLHNGQKIYLQNSPPYLDK